MDIAIGTLNRVKLAASFAVLNKVWPDAVLHPVAVSSGVSEQPLTDQETVKGAINRAVCARRASRAEIGIGLEGGISQQTFGNFTSEWCAVVDQEERVWLGGGANLLIPQAIFNQLTTGYELGNVIDQITGLTSSKTGPGTLGVLTCGLINRQESYEIIIKLAIAPLISPSYYQFKEINLFNSQTSGKLVAP